MKKEIVDALVESLKDPSAGWVFSKYTAKNERVKCEIWLGNGLSFVEVKFWGDKIGPRTGEWERQTKFGGMNMLGFLVPWRWRVYWVAAAKQFAALNQEKTPTSTIVAAIRSASTEGSL